VLGEPAHRVDRTVVDADLDMQVRPGRLTLVADQGDRLADRDVPGCDE